jgi:hypothetical protein
MVYQHRKNISNYKKDEWVRNSVFKGLKEEDILDRLSVMGMQELLFNFNDAMASGIDREDVKLCFEKALADGASVIPIKMCLGMFENMHLCINMDAKRGRWSDEKESEYQMISKSKYYLGDYLSNIMVSKATIQEKIPNKIVVGIDESGSQQSRLHGSNLAVDKLFFSAMMSYQLLLSASDVEFVFTGRQRAIRTEKLLSPYKVDFIEFWLDFDNKAEKDDGLYLYSTIKYIDKHFTLSKNDLIIVFADSGCGEPHKTKAYYADWKDTPKICFNVEPDDYNNMLEIPVAKFCYPTEIFNLMIGGYSDFWLEPIFRIKNIKSSSAKNCDASGFNNRLEF